LTTETFKVDLRTQLVELDFRSSILAACTQRQLGDRSFHYPLFDESLNALRFHHRFGDKLVTLWQKPKDDDGIGEDAVLDAHVCDQKRSQDTSVWVVLSAAASYGSTQNKGVCEGVAHFTPKNRLTIWFPFEP
jgi:hypothetical protein